MAKKGKKLVQPNWHPDFRNVETLPDIKLIRTGFWVNGGAAVIALVAIIFVVRDELEVRAYAAELADLEGQVAKLSGSDQGLLRKNGEYLRIKAEMDELAAFKKSPIIPSQFLQALAVVRPEKITLTEIDYRRDSDQIGSGRLAKKIYFHVLTIDGQVSSEAFDEAEAIKSDFQSKIKGLAALKDSLDELKEEKFDHEPSLGLFIFQFKIKLKPNEPAPAPAKE